MSRYLQRITASVLQPQPRIHPLVQSIFAPTNLEETSTSIVPSDAQPASLLASKLSAGSRPASASQRTRESSVDDETHSSAKFNATNLPPALLNTAPLDPTSGSREIFQPLLPQASSREQLTDVSTPSLHASTAPAPPASPLPSLGSHTAAASAPDWKFQPIVTESASASSTKVEPSLHAVAPKSDSPSHATRPAPLRASSPNVSAHRMPPPQPDEIQIHIGRIEVVAMPAPAPREVRAPIRKSQSLDEYLRRSNGRA